MSEDKDHRKPQKPGKYKGKRDNREEGQRGDKKRRNRKITNREESRRRAKWPFKKNRERKLSEGEQKLQERLPEGFEICSWESPVCRTEELVFYVPVSTLTLLLNTGIRSIFLWKYLYVLNQVQLGYFRYQANESNGFYTKVSSRHLDRVINGYKEVLVHLIKLGILDVRVGPSYRTSEGEKRRKKNSFCIRPKHRTKTDRVVHKFPKKATQAHERHQKQIREAIGGNPNRQHIWESMQGTTIDPEALGHIKGLSDVSDCQRDCYRRSVETILAGELYFSIDGKTGRVFNNFVNLWSELRPFLRIDGESLCEIDIANSQPLLAAELYPEDSEEKKRYLEVVLEGNFYRRLEAHSGRKYPDYKKLKQLVFAQVFFGSISDGKQRPLLRAFKALFPELLEIFNNLKKHQKNKLALELQSIEAELVIGKVVDRLRLLGIPCLTVHDSIVCKASDEERAYEALDQELEKLIGHKCKIKRMNSPVVPFSWFVRPV